MKIMSFNTLHCMDYKTKEIDFGKFADEILLSEASFVGLNEIRGKGFLKGYTAQAKKLSRLTGMNYYFGEAIRVKGLAPYGNAFLSRFPILSAETVKIPDPDKKTGQEKYESRCIIKAKVHMGEEYTLLITHMGLNKDERENAVKLLLSLAEKEKCIIMGDFNCTPEKEELKPLYKDFVSRGTDKFTFPSDKPDRKIDYIFTSKDIEVISEGVTENVISDHLAVWIEIKEK